MGKEWLYWVGGRSGGGEIGGGGGGGGNGSTKSTTKRGRMPREMREAATSTGCMYAVFHLLDLHHFQFHVNQHNPSDHFYPNKYPFLQEEATTSKGVEAPRNSLELEEPAAMNAASMSFAMKEEESLNFPVGIQIKTSHGKISSPRISTSASKSQKSDDFSSECSSNSPGAKTPGVVARLMGLDLLPECSSPSIPSPSPKPHKKSRLLQRKDRYLLRSRSSTSFFFDDDDIIVGARSLPETPRVSSSRISDVEHHRLSLQMTKEKRNEEFALSDKMAAPRGRFRQQPPDENVSPRHNAKHIVKHVRDSVSRRVGLDITNTINRNREHNRRDENLVPTKKNSKASSRFEGQISPDHGKQSSTPSRSPRLRFLDRNKNKQTTTATNSVTKDSSISSNPLRPKPQVIVPFQEKCSSSRLKKLHPHHRAIRSKKEEAFVRSTAANKLNLTDNKCKRIPFSSETLLQVRKGPSPPHTKLPQEQSQVSSDARPSKSSTQLSCSPSQPYKRPQLQPHKIFTLPATVSPGSTGGCATALRGGASAEYASYIESILRHAGIINKWHIPSNPINPLIFHHLELFRPTTTNSASGAECNSILKHRCNRKLIFQLVDELLAEISTPHFNLNPWISPASEDGIFPLVDELCKKIDTYPAANCLVLEDIDSLIDKDLLKSQLNGYFDQEENIICEIEGEIVEWLLHETVAVMGGDAAEQNTQTDTRHVRLLRCKY